jgi:hypothetical protein
MCTHSCCVAQFTRSCNLACTHIICLYACFKRFAGWTRLGFGLPGRGPEDLHKVAKTSIETAAAKSSSSAAVTGSGGGLSVTSPRLQSNVTVSSNGAGETVSAGPSGNGHYCNVRYCNCLCYDSETAVLQYRHIQSCCLGYKTL